MKAGKGIWALSVLVFFLFAALECDKNPEPDPDGDIVKMSVNGKDWVAKTQEWSGPAVVVGYHDQQLMLVANNTVSGWDTELNLRVRNMLDTGIYVLNNLNPGRGSWKDNSKVNDSWHYSDSLNAGQLHLVNLDHENRKMKGYFYFNALNSAGDTVKVTNGFFDVKF